MNFINSRETSLTGLTRDGTFLIEDGKISKVVNNLRFTERIERILNNVLELENRCHTIPFSSLLAGHVACLTHGNTGKIPAL